MIDFYLYETSTGRVLAVADYNEIGDGAAARTLGLGYINPDTQYAPGGVVTARGEMSTVAVDKAGAIANSVDAVTITGIPNPARVTVTKDVEVLPRSITTVADGTAVLTFNAAGTYLVRIAAFPLQDKLISIVVTP